MRSFDIVNIVNNIICQTAVDRILVCHDNSSMRRTETGYTPRFLLKSASRRHHQPACLDQRFACCMDGVSVIELEE
jgi:hypothetical protein